MQGRAPTRAERPYNWRQVEKPRFGRSRARVALFVAGLIVLLFLAVVLYGEYELHSAQNSSSAPFAFTIRPGETEATIANRLQQRGILHNTFLFRLDAKLRGLGGNLHVGTYTLRPNMSIDQMVSALTSGQGKLLLVTVPEGWRASQIAGRLTGDGIKASQFLRAVEKGRWSPGFPTGIPAHHSLEGFLFPDTYSIVPGTTGETFAREMLSQFAKEYTPAMRAQTRREHRSIFSIVTLASIVEREARVPSERAKIASVYYNRLRAHMFLDADPTVQYAMGTSRNWWPVLSVSDYRSVRSPYNTYLRRGLPPGPIDNPGLASLRAALYPAHTRYYYFVAKGNTGYHVFARTYAQQQANIARYR